MQVSLSQVFMGMKQAQHQQLFTVLDWGVANAKLEEVIPSRTAELLRCNLSRVVLCLYLAAWAAHRPVRQVQIIAMYMQDLYMMHRTISRRPCLANQV